jgi:hypothetical protein
LFDSIADCNLATVTFATSIGYARRLGRRVDWMGRGTATMSSGAMPTGDTHPLAAPHH